MPSSSLRWEVSGRRYSNNGKTFYDAVIKAEKMICQPSTIKDVREAIDFFNSTHKGISSSDEKTFFAKKENAARILNVYDLSLAFQFPDDAIEKNAIWNERIRPKLEGVRDILKYEKLVKELKLPAKATREEVDKHLADIKSVKAEHAKKIRQKKKELEKQREQHERQRLGLDAKADVGLAAELVEKTRSKLLAERTSTAGYLYFKVWVLPDNSKWYKIGISNNLDRRDAEQNVLPAPPTTLCSVKFFSIDYARVAEKQFHSVLRRHRITGAKNKELFTLKPQEVQAVIGAMKGLKDFCF